MDSDASQYSRTVDPPVSEPVWVTRTLRLLPLPILTFAVTATGFSASIFCAMWAYVDRSPTAWVLCSIFAALSLLIASASLVRFRYRRRAGKPESPRCAKSERRTTLAILALLTSVYSWMLTIGLHMFEQFFAANRPGGVKYYVTLGIALASSFYMSVHGRYVIRQQFGPGGGRNISVSPRQAVFVVLFAIGCGIYFAWLME